MLQQTAEELSDSDSFMKTSLRNAELVRRERPTLDANPLPAVVMDYAQSGTVMELAMGHLRESIPSGQRSRTEHAWRALKEAVKQQEIWLRAKGYHV